MNIKSESRKAKQREWVTMKLNQDVKEIIGALLGRITTHPDDLVVDVEVSGRVGWVEITANKADTSRIIGRKGIQFRAVSSICRAIGAKAGVQLKTNRISDPVKGESERYNYCKPTDDWPKGEIIALLDRTARAIFSDVAVGFSDKTHHRTILTVDVEADAPAAKIDDLTESFNYMFDAIGKACGRELLVNIVPELPVDRQPATNAGRFA